MLINPGSRIGHRPAKGNWSNTFEKAREHAFDWLRGMHADGLVEVSLAREDKTQDEGRWSFYFRHAVTGVEVELSTHGIDNLDEYRKDAIFTPRIYWKGSSTGEPAIEDFAAPGFRAHKTFVKEP